MVTHVRYTKSFQKRFIKFLYLRACRRSLIRELALREFRMMSARVGYGAPASDRCAGRGFFLGSFDRHQPHTRASLEATAPVTRNVANALESTEIFYLCRVCGPKGCILYIRVVNLFLLRNLPTACHGTRDGRESVILISNNLF